MRWCVVEDSTHLCDRVKPKCIKKGKNIAVVGRATAPLRNGMNHIGPSRAIATGPAARTWRSSSSSVWARWPVGSIFHDILKAVLAQVATPPLRLNIDNGSCSQGPIWRHQALCSACRQGGFWYVPKHGPSASSLVADLVLVVATDFADFAEAADPSPEPFTPVVGGASLGVNAPVATGRPYTKWYRLNERYTLNDFRAEGVILACVLVIFTLHIIGSRLNRAKARKWIKAHSKTLASEFALVGFGRTAATEGPADDLSAPEKALKEKSLFEYATYATGRQNVAFLDAKLTLIRRFNPLMSLAEAGLSLFFDSFKSPQDSVEVTIYPFDGKENMLIPGVPGTAELRSKDLKSSYDGFVWAIVNKDRMKQVREERFDVSLTFTKDHNKLPVWLTVMGESAEITNVLLTSDLIKAAQSAGELLDYLIVSDQPEDKPKTYVLVCYYFLVPTTDF